MTSCEMCLYWQYDEEYDDWNCEMQLDQDEFERFMLGQTSRCPYYTPGDEYTIVKKQN